MKSFITHILKTKLFLSLFLTFAAFQIGFSTNNLNGPNPVTANTQHTYTFDYGFVYLTHSWQITGGSLVSSSVSGTVFSAVVLWGSQGTGSIAFSSGKGVMETDSITIDAYVPPPPTNLSDENYIHTITPKIATTVISALTNEDKLETVTYFDGLGRPMQSIGIRAGGDSEDIITHIDYDDFGRQDKDYLPYAEASNAGAYTTTAFTNTESFYDLRFPSEWGTGDTVNPFSQKEFEPSPLSRVLKQAAPGKDWELDGGHEIEFVYNANTATEVKLFTVNLTLANNTYTPALAGGTNHYGVGELYKVITYDENHDGSATKNHTTEEFKDKNGRVLVKRTYANVGSPSVVEEHDTYYVYDDYGNLTYVLPPKMDAHTTILATIQTQLNDLGYQYKYDYRNRLVEKKIPGKGWESIVYDKLDRPVLTQDANLMTSDHWLFTKYDALGRVAYTGKMLIQGESRTSMQTLVNTQTTLEETSTTSITYIQGWPVYYTNLALDFSSIAANITELYTINYYDSYNSALSTAVPNPTTVFLASVSSNTKMLATGSLVYVLDKSDWITTVNYYDNKGRVIYTGSKNEYLDTTDIIKMDLDDFTGQVLKTESSHTKGASAAIVVTDDFLYDDMNRLTTQTQTITGETAEVIVENAYDNLGQLISKGVGGATARLQTVDYTYNIRGWLKQINNPASLGTDVFGFKINYNTVDHSGTKLFNGNIAETEWKTANTDNSLKWYKYSYDALNRITSGTDNTSQNNYGLNNVDYDKNGNITNLTRRGHTNAGATTFGVMDDLTYSYDAGNKLMRVADDSATELFGFVDDAFNKTDGVDDYTYDVNGNMLTDTNKGISSNITYNHLNLPKQVTLIGGNISYIYDASGVKLEKVITEGSSVTKTKYAGNYVYKNTGGSDALEFFNHPEGYVDASGSGYDYVYQYKDIWGNTRISYSDANNNGSVDSSEIKREQNYYPFGLEHKGYNGAMSGVKNNLKTYQGQEFTDDLGLNTHEWKYRVSDPSIGRFWQIDPLAEKYMYNSTYAFQENKLGSGIELEGLENVSWLDQAISGLNRVFVKPVKAERARKAKQIATYGTDPSPGPTKNITGNYFGDAIYKLVGGETISKAMAGDDRAKGQVIMNALLSLAPGSRVNPVDNIATKTALVTEKSIVKALDGSPMKTIQSEVSLPIVQRYVDKLDAGLTAPAIKVDNGVIVDGNHRFVAGEVAGKPVTSTPGVVPRSSRELIKPVSELKVVPVDYDN